MRRYFPRKAVPEERLYEIIEAPVITEKATLLGEHNQVVFRVASDASKPEIKQAVETLFKVKVKRVNTVLAKGKQKRLRIIKNGRAQPSRQQIRHSDVKKAIVTLEEGQSIDIMSGL